MTVGLINTPLFQYLKCQDQRISEILWKHFHILQVKKSLRGGPFFTFTFPGGGGAHPCPSLSVTLLTVRSSHECSGSVICNFWSPVASEELSCHTHLALMRTSYSYAMKNYFKTSLAFLER